MDEFKDYVKQILDDKYIDKVVQEVHNNWDAYQPDDNVYSPKNRITPARFKTNNFLNLIAEVENSRDEEDSFLPNENLKGKVDDWKFV